MSAENYNLSDAVKMKMIRRFRGWTIEDLAKKLNCSGSKISNIENGLKTSGNIHEKLIEDVKKLEEMYNLFCNALYKSYDEETADEIKNYFDLIYQNL